MSRDTYRDTRPGPPRERSPLSSNRYRPAGPSYPNAPFQRSRDFSASHHDAPRGPRGVIDTPRGPSLSAPRGRGGFTGRNFEPRDSRDSTFNSDRGPYEGGDRWNPPRARSPARRESQLPRQLDTDRARLENRDGPQSAGSNPPDFSFRGGSSFRGGGYRGRGDGYRGERPRMEDRTVRPRSRDRSADSARLDFRERARDNDERSYIRDRTDERDFHARRTDLLPHRLGARGPAENRATQLPPTPQGDRAPLSHNTLPERGIGDPRREYDPSRRGSALSENIRDGRRELERTDPNAGRPDSQRAPRPASPPPAVPSFGFRTPAPFAGVTSLSWKNPDLAKPPPASGPAQPMKTAPTAPKALAVAPPSAPKADRGLEKTPSKESLIAHTIEDTKDVGMTVGASPSPRLTSGIMADTLQQLKYSPSVAAGFLNPPSAPRAMASPQPPFGRPGVSGIFGRAISPVQANNSIPTGPKAATVIASPRIGAGTIPTGPRAERAAPPAGPRILPPAPKIFRPNSQPFPRTSVVPSKRDINGFDREPSLSHEARPVDAASRPFNNGLANQRNDRTAVKQETHLVEKPQADVDMPDAQSNGQTISPSIDDGQGPFQHLTDDEDEDLDLDDMAEMLENKFLHDKKRLEVKRTDLSARALRPTLLFPEISRIVAMRGMINDLSYRTRAPADKKDAHVKPKDPVREMLQAPPMPAVTMPSPREEHQDDIMMDAYSSRESSIDRLSTPDSTDLPYLEHGPPTPLSDPDPFATIKREIQEDGIKLILKEELDVANHEQARLEQEYRKKYTSWKREIMQFDKQKTENEHEAKQCSPEYVGPTTTAVDVLMPALATPTDATRSRAHRWASDYDLQMVMEISLREEEEKRLKEVAIREAQLSATADREADIPPLLPPYMAHRRKFEDFSQARRPEDAIRFFEFVPQVDDFTQEEDQKMREVYKEWPKVWGRIASIVGRSYKECINHYYASKWDRPYKARVGGKRGRARGAGKKRNPGQRSALVPAEDAGEDASGVPMVTESGRPKRAAAPVWPKDSEQDLGTAANVIGKRAGKPESEAGEQKPAGRRKVKEKAPKKTVRNQPLAARPVLSPQKVDREVKDKPAQAIDLDDPWLMSAIRPTEPMSLLPQSHLYPDEAIYRSAVDLPPGSLGPGERPRSHSNTTQRQGASSYWSVTEEQDFQRCLEYYGTDFQLISNHMGTKTLTMIKNHYQKFVNDGKHADLVVRAEEANSRRSRGEDMGPPPIPSQAVKRHGRYDTTNMPMPRNLAPNGEVPEADQSPPTAVAVPFGLSPQFGPHASIPTVHSRSSVPQPPPTAIQRPHQAGPMLGYFKDDGRQPPALQNAIRPLIAPPEEPRIPRGPERIKTEFRPVEQEREMLARQQQEQHDRELREEMTRRADLLEARNAQMVAERRDQVFHRGHHVSHASQSSKHGMSPTSEHMRHEPRQPISQYGGAMTVSAMHGHRNALVELATPQPHQMAHSIDRRALSPAPRHPFGPSSQPQSAVASPAQAPAVTKEAPRRSNLMNLLNSEPEPEALKARDLELSAKPAHHQRMKSSVQSETPPSAVSAREPLHDRPFSRPTYPPIGPPHSSMSTPTHEELPSGRDSLPPMAQQHRDSWPGRQPPNLQATNSPGLHPQHAPPIQERAPLFARGDHRQFAFGQLNSSTRANPSPPPNAGKLQQHSRTPSYSHAQHATPPTSLTMGQTSQPTSHHNGYFGHREPLQPGMSPHLRPQHQPPSSTRPDISREIGALQNQAMFDHFRERERPLDFDFAGVRERALDREREQHAAREREYREQVELQQRFGHQTPPINHPRFPPPQQAVPERSTATPLSHGGYPPREAHSQQLAQRQFEFKQEEQRRQFEREHSRQTRINEAAAQAEETQRRIQLDALRRGGQDPLFRGAEDRYGRGIPPR